MAKLEAELARVKFERDMYKKSIYDSEFDVPMTEAEMVELMNAPQGESIISIIEEFEGKYCSSLRVSSIEIEALRGFVWVTFGPCTLEFPIIRGVFVFSRPRKPVTIVVWPSSHDSATFTRSLDSSLPLPFVASSATPTPSSLP